MNLRKNFCEKLISVPNDIINNFKILPQTSVFELQHPSSTIWKVDRFPFGIRKFFSFKIKNFGYFECRENSSEDLFIIQACNVEII